MNDERGLQIQAFLDSIGWKNAQISTLAGDASNRRYFRLSHGPDDAHAVLMDDPPGTGESVALFQAIATYFRAKGFSTPQIYHCDTAQGFMLLEDLGDALFAREVAQTPELEETLYSSATDVLLSLHKLPAPKDMGCYNAALMTQLSRLTFDWYQPAVGAPVSEGQKAAFLTVLETELKRLSNDTNVVVHRDYHAENLVWLPERDGVKRVGILDFQSALTGHPAYDLVSLLEDARRDVPKNIQQAMIARYVEASGVSDVDFRAAYAVLGAQRNLRILGVFARLCVRDGKSGYVDLIPRVWGHLQHDLSHPTLSKLKHLADTTLTPPTSETLKRIKAQCATRQNP